MAASSEADVPSQLRNAFTRGGEMGRRMLALDWATTPLGPPADWPAELQHAVATMLASRAQIVLFWGPDYCALYNDAYIVTMGSKHPGHLGRPGSEMWAEAWSVLQDLFDGVRRADEVFWAADHPFMLERHGFLEETYFDISYDPIRTSSGAVGGVFCIVSDTTGRVLGERRVRTLGALGTRLADAPDQAALGAQVAAVLGENAGDVPFAALYLNEPDDDLALVGLCGVRESALRAPDAMAAVLESGRPSLVPARAVCDPPPPSAGDQALVLPVGVGTGSVGVLIVGISR